MLWAHLNWRVLAVKITEENIAPDPNELNRLWQHGMHEERLFHDRLNYFSAVQVGLLEPLQFYTTKNRHQECFFHSSRLGSSFRSCCFVCRCATGNIVFMCMNESK